jgi:hypothetical protein
LGALAALAITGCESSQEKSARLERLAKQQVRAAPKGLVITHANRSIKVVGSTILTSSEGSAVVVKLRNESGRALRAIPLEIQVRDAAGASVYSNTTPGLAHALTTVALIPAHGEVAWIDDQVQAAGGTPSSVKATVGEAPAATGAVPRITVGGTHLNEGPEGTAVEGTVSNGSQVAQGELVVYALAERGGRIVAAGRAVLTELAPGGAASYRAFLVGSPSGAQLHVEAPASATG